MHEHQAIRFRLNGENIELKHVAADATLLDYLRLDAKLRGTKEGCAEGDCGACTVLVGRLIDGQLNYQTVNACIRLVGSLNACHVVTIEHLQNEDGSPHLLQQAMVEHHASQCGFCTPGVVMSLYGLFLNRSRDNTAKPDTLAIETALQGNLCRCTGYEPIVKAALSVTQQEGLLKDRLAQDAKATVDALAQMAQSERITLTVDDTLPEPEVIVPADLDDLAHAYCKHPTATVVAGATDVGLWVTKHFAEITPAIFIDHLREMATIEETDLALRIGATASYSQARDSLCKHFPAMAPYWHRIGGEQVRNMGTIGGNIANGSPIGDTPPPLIALGSTLVLRHGDNRRSLPLEDFFIAYGKQDRNPGEFIEAIEVPLLKANQRFAVYKISKRQEEDISAVTAAFCLSCAPDETVTDIRICYGGMAGTPKRATKTEQFIKGKSWSEATAQKAMGLLTEEYQPLTDWRASSDYRMQVAQNLLLRFFRETTGSADNLQSFVVQWQGAA